MKKQECLDLEPKCHFWIFLTKIALFGYLWWGRIFKKLLSDLKSTPSNLSICKISRKNKNVKCLIYVFLSKFWTKNVLFWCFWARDLENYCHI